MYIDYTLQPGLGGTTEPTSALTTYALGEEGGSDTATTGMDENTFSAITTTALGEEGGSETVHASGEDGGDSFIAQVL